MGSSTIASTHMHRFPGTWRISISWCKTPYPSARTRRYGGPSACPVSHLLSGLQRLHWEHAAPTGNAETKATKSDATSRAENDGSKTKATHRDEIATNRDESRWIPEFPHQNNFDDLRRKRTEKHAATEVPRTSGTMGRNLPAAGNQC